MGWSMGNCDRFMRWIRLGTDKGSVDRALSGHYIGGRTEMPLGSSVGGTDIYIGGE